MVLDIWQYLLHLALTNIEAWRFLLVFIVCGLIAVMFFFIGKDVGRRKAEKEQTPSKLLKEARGDIKEKNALIDKQIKLLNFYQNMAYGKVIKAIQEAADTISMGDSSSG